MINDYKMVELIRQNNTDTIVLSKGDGSPDIKFIDLVAYDELKQELVAARDVLDGIVNKPKWQYAVVTIKIAREALARIDKVLK